MSVSSRSAKKASVDTYVYLSQKCKSSIWIRTRAPSSTLGDIDICVGGLFGTKFNSEQFLFVALFDVMRIFPNVIFRFSTT